MAGGAAERRRRALLKKSLSVTDAMGFCLGVVGMRLDDFMRLTLKEADAVCHSYHETEEQRDRGAWERMRMLAAISIQPHVKKKISPKSLIQFPWENVRKAEVERPQEPPLTQAEAKDRFLRAVGAPKGMNSDPEVISA